jgi:hypothetical protein
MKRAVLILAMLMASAVVTQAGTIVHTIPYGPLGIPSNSFVLVPQYNGADPLLSIKLELISDAAGGSIEWDNEDPVTGTVTLKIGATITATGPSSVTMITIPSQEGTTSVAADNDGAPDYIGTDAFAVTSGTGHDEDSDTLTNTALFTPYVGTGNFQVDLSSAVFTSVETTGVSGVSRSTNGTTTGSIKVTYEYIPEPATMALLSLGGLAMLRRRR